MLTLIHCKAIRWALLPALWAMIACPVSLAAPPTLQVLVVTGEAAPDGNGTFNSIIDQPLPPLNDAGQAAFGASLDGAPDADDGIFLAEVSGVIRVGREGETSPDGNGTFFSFPRSRILTNSAGQVVFHATLENTSGGSSDNLGIYRYDGPGRVTLARIGDSVPIGGGTFTNFNRIVLNNVGQIATDVGIDDQDSGIYRIDETGYTRIAREGDAAPDSSQTFVSFGDPALNDNGQTAFGTTLSDGTGGLLRSDGISQTWIARENDNVPGDGNISSFLQSPAINNAGQVAFNALLGGVGVSFGNNEAIYLGDGTGLTRVAREGQASPDGDGTFGDGEFDEYALNEAGQVAFITNLQDTDGGFDDNQGIYISNGGTLEQIVRADDAVPNGDGDFNFFGKLALNDQGQIAFRAGLEETSGSSEFPDAIFVYDEQLGLMEVARAGDPLLNSTISDLELADGINERGNPASGLNNAGQIAFRFDLEDGREGIALWTIPEPATLGLLAIGGLAMLKRKRKA